MSDIKQQLIDGMRGQGVLVPNPLSTPEDHPGGEQWWLLDEKNLEWIIERLLRTPRIAIVELPEPKRPSENVGLFLSRDGYAVNMYGDYYNQTPDEMRSHAAALLAAAAQAPEEQHP